MKVDTLDRSDGSKPSLDCEDKYCYNRADYSADGVNLCQICTVGLLASRITMLEDLTQKLSDITSAPLIYPSALKGS